MRVARARSSHHPAGCFNAYSAVNQTHVRTPKTKLPGELSVKEAAELLGLTTGGLRGIILRHRLPAHKDAEGRHVLDTRDVASYHFYGQHRPWQEMSDMANTLLVEALAFRADDLTRGGQRQ